MKQPQRDYADFLTEAQRDYADLLTEDERESKAKVGIFELQRRRLEQDTIKAELNIASECFTPEIFDIFAVEKDNVQLEGAFFKQLRTDGWAFVSLPEQLQFDCKCVADDLIRFFAQDASEKSMFSTHTPLGYSAVRGMQEDGTDGPVFKQKLTFLSHELATSAMPSPTPIARSICWED